MYTIVLVIYIILAVFLCGIVLLQRPDGGALGGLGGGTGSNFMTGRAVGNMLTKTTSVLALLFFVTALILGILAKQETKPTLAPISSAPVQSQNE